VASSTSQAYCRGPPLPLADKLTVAVVFSVLVVGIVTLEAVGATLAKTVPDTLPLASASLLLLVDSK
jgi:hypothetical protein